MRHYPLQRQDAVIFAHVHMLSINVLRHIERAIKIKQEPWRLPSRQAEFNRTNRLRLDADSHDRQ